jgi:hypothetical protein
MREARRTTSKGGRELIWDFFQRYDESWIWRCADRHQVTESARNFAALEECMEDAARHGYVPAGAERQRRDARTAVRRRNKRSATLPRRVVRP